LTKDKRCAARATKLSTVYILATGGHRRRRRASLSFTLEYYVLSANREQGENRGNLRLDSTVRPRPKKRRRRF